MPITITLPHDTTDWIGPGADIQVRSDFIGPLPSDAQWDYRVILGGDVADPWVEHVFSQVNPNANTLMVKSSNKSSTRTKDQPSDGQEVTLRVEINTPSGIIDSGQATAQWRTTKALGQQAFLQPSASVASGAFTDQDRALLTATERRSQTVGEPTDLVIQAASGPQIVTLAQMLARKALDLLTLDELTDGESFDPVRVSIGLWFYGIIVRVTTISPDLVPKTPDAQWYFPDLAVLRIFRGVDLEYRRGIHTPTFMQENPWQWGWQFLNEFPILGVPPDTTVAVDWREGCAGQVFVQRLP